MISGEESLSGVPVRPYGVQQQGRAAIHVIDTRMADAVENFAGLSDSTGVGQLRKVVRCFGETVPQFSNLFVVIGQNDQSRQFQTRNRQSDRVTVGFFDGTCNNVGRGDEIRVGQFAAGPRYGYRCVFDDGFIDPAVIMVTQQGDRDDRGVLIME